MINNILFVHDGPRWKDSSGQSFGTDTDLEMMRRYSLLGNNVSFAMRVDKVSNTGAMVNLSSHGLEVQSVKAFNRPKLLHNYWRSRKLLQKLIEKTDFLVVRLPSTIGSVALKIALDLDKPVLVEVVACPWDALSNHSLLGKLYAPFSMLKLKRLVKKSPFVMYVTSEFLQRRYPTNYKAIGLSDVIIKQFASNNPSELKYLSFSPTKKIVFCTIGAIDLAYKGQRFVIKSISRLKNMGLDIQYLIVGGGDRTQLEKVAKKYGLYENIRFTGKLPHSEIFQILKETHVYIQPSKQEGLPRSLVEAMSQGCACIGSNVGGIPELLPTSSIFKKGNVRDLTEKIKKLLNKDSLISNSSYCFEKSKSFRHEILEKRRTEFYMEVLKNYEK